jgi:prepilin-type N-terminal cleavage/methylation domain-containing protein
MAISELIRTINNPPLPVHAARKQQRLAMQIKTNRKLGFTLVEIMIVVAIIGLLAAIAIPNFVKARTTAQKNSCIANLRQIDGAKEQWALENKKTTGAACTMDDVDDYLKSVPVCPAGTGAYTPNAIGTAPACPNVATLADHVLP